MKHSSALPLLLAGAVLACQSAAPRREPASPLNVESGLEEVSIVSKGLE